MFVRLANLDKAVEATKPSLNLTKSHCLEPFSTSDSSFPKVCLNIVVLKELCVVRIVVGILLFV